MRIVGGDVNSMNSPRELTPIKSSVSSVVSLAEATVLTYTIPADKIFHIQSMIASGNVQGRYKLYINSVEKLAGETTDYNKESKDFFGGTVGIKCVEGDVIELKVTNLALTSGNFDATIAGFLEDSGWSGYSGWSGISGYSGATGHSGYSGGSGISGDTYSGESGYSGQDGIIGHDGASGYSGFSGYSGQIGAKGDSGYSGQGDSGISGYSGYSGVKGDEGLSGYSGISGYSGFSGYSGDSTSGYSGLGFSWERIYNGTFDTNIVGWVNYPGQAYNQFGWVGGKLYIATDQNNRVLGGQDTVNGNYCFQLEQGHTYILSCDFQLDYSSTYPEISVCGEGFLPPLVLNMAQVAEGHNSWIFVCNEATGNYQIEFEQFTPGGGYFDNISLKEVGALGESGYSGISGYSGEVSLSGYSGYSGVSGYSGFDGEAGTSGYSGESGASGYTLNMHVQNTDKILLNATGELLEISQPYQDGYQDVSYSGGDWFQTFAIIHSGTITKVAFNLAKFAGTTADLKVRIFATVWDSGVSSYVPTGVALAEENILADDVSEFNVEREVVFSSPASVTVGIVYALYISSNEATYKYRIRFTSGDVLISGVFGHIDPSAEPPISYDIYTYNSLQCKIYVTTSSGELIDNGILKADLFVASGVKIAGTFGISAIGTIEATELKASYLTGIVTYQGVYPFQQILFGINDAINNMDYLTMSQIGTAQYYFGRYMDFYGEFDLGLSPNSKWRDLWLSRTAYVNTLTLSTGSITDSTGAIDFGNENLKTSGTFEAGGIFDNQPFVYQGRKVLIVSPYATKTNSYKGQIHCHSTNSDGVDTPTALVTAYKNAGYDFISITDHDQVTVSPAVAGILFIQGSEETTDSGHLSAIGVTSTVTSTVPQTVIDAIKADGGVSFLAHPNKTGFLWTDAEIAAIKNYFGIEVWNNLADVGNAEDKIDTALSLYNSFYLTAVDDCHDISDSSFDKAWLQVFGNAITQSEIMDSLKRGNFYATQGPTLSIYINQKVITVNADSASTIAFIKTGGVTAQTTPNVTTANYTIIGDEKYICIKITRDSDSKIAWSNPILVLLEGFDRDYNSLNNKPTIPTALADLTDDSTHRIVSDTEKNTWNGKQAALGFTPEDVTNKSNDIITDAASTTKYPSVKSIKDYADGLLTSALTYKGAINCSGNPDYPAATVGDLYVVSVAGKIGGVSGASVVVGNMLICNTTTVSGDQATVGSKWNIIATSETDPIAMAYIDQSVKVASSPTFNNLTVSGYEWVKGRNISQAQPADPATPAAADGTYRMAGVGGALKLTPKFSGKINVRLNLKAKQDITGGSVVCQLVYGTGTAPANQAAATGTVIGAPVTIINGNVGTQSLLPMVWDRPVAETLTPNTAYWFDLQFKTSGGLNAKQTLSGIESTIEEI